MRTTVSRPAFPFGAGLLSSAEQACAKTPGRLVWAEDVSKQLGQGEVIQSKLFHAKTRAEVWEAYWRSPQQRLAMYEVINGRAPCPMYLDIDMKVSLTSVHTFTHAACVGVYVIVYVCVLVAFCAH